LSIPNITPGSILVHFLPTLGFVLAIVLLSHILRQRRSPASTLAWLLAIIVIPYVGVPLYLMLGGRKMARQSGAKRQLALSGSKNPSDLLQHAGTSAGPLGSSTAPLFDENRIVLLISGEQAFTEALQLINRAADHICVATFILGKDDTGSAIVAALADQAARGVLVHLLLDALGSHRVKGRFLAPLTKAGGHVAFFMPMLHLPFRGRANLRNHRKMIMADGRAALVGGMNLAVEYMGPTIDPERWRDLAARIEGAAIRHLYDIFRSDWEFAAHQSLPASVAAPALTSGESLGGLRVMASGPDCPLDTIREAIIAAVFQAQERIWIVTPYFVPDEVLIEALCMAARRGIDLRVIVPERSNHRLADLARSSYLSMLQEAGASIRLFQPTMLHAKAVLFDHSLAIVGSANMDMRSLLLNYEVALSIPDPKVVAELETWMQALMSDCVPRTPQGRHPVSAWEGIGRLFAPLL